MLGSRKGVNLPGKEVDLPALSAKDKADIAFGMEKNIDVIFASFIRKASDIDEIRAELGERGKHILIVSKVCPCTGCPALQRAGCWVVVQ